MTELDLGLKVASRRLLWRMGFTTRIDVPLRALVPGGTAQRDRSPEAFTDLDVLGLTISSGFRLQTTIADCKSGKNAKAIERLFWLRGVADFFEASDGWVVMSRKPPDAARQLSSRLGMTLLTGTDLSGLEDLHETSLPITSPAVARLFDEKQVAHYLSAFVGLSKKLRPLLEYRQFDYFLYEPYRNPVQLVAHLTEAAPHLDPRNPLHVSVYIDLAWLYLVSITQIVEHIRSSHFDDHETGLQEYLFGGQLGLKEKRKMAALLDQIAPEGAEKANPLPSYYPQLRELVFRVLRRPDHILDSLRYAEVVAAGLSEGIRVRLRTAFSDCYDEISAKLLNDVCVFLATAADLDPEFRNQAQRLLLEVDGDALGQQDLMHDS